MSAQPLPPSIIPAAALPLPSQCGLHRSPATCATAAAGTPTNWSVQSH